MKKAMLPFILLFGLAAVAAAADTTPATGSAPALCAATLSSPVDAVPAPVFLTPCSASLECICGGTTVTISCTGDSTCRVGTRWVECDGERERCPPITSCPH